jgi:hypothetical protein
MQRLVLLAGALALLTACAGGSAGPVPAATGIDRGSIASSPPAAPSLSPSAAPSRTPLPARFRGTVSAIPPGLAAEMRGGTWHPGCPVPLSDLRLLGLRYWGFHGHVHAGRMVVNASVAHDVISVFRQLFQARFPIKQLHLAVPYRGVDDPTDRRDYTVGFNCRPALTARGPLSNWSQHAYGLAIDVNPMQNPYVTSDGFIRNYHARRFRDRSQELVGMVHPGDAVVRAFTSIGWTWGGDWSGDKDYMHFSLTGR